MTTHKTRALAFEKAPPAAQVETTTRKCKGKAREENGGDEGAYRVCCVSDERRPLSRVPVGLP